ncbi:MAG: GNAT family N-acetyltransferase [Deltaproteobacteria bacterium]|nr:GNAT family N-acetyltransferase [Deltaproteobacteria bacterium]
MTLLEVPDDAGRAEYAAVAAHAFGFPVADAPDWFARAGHENLRVLRADERVAAGLMVVPMGQFFGGRSVPCLGVAGVAVSPEARGAGVATRLMVETVRQARASGFALSTLYPATVQLYRRAGYARAGARNVIELTPNAAETGARDLRVSRVVAGAAEEDAELRSVYARFAARRNGFLDRGPYVWGRVHRPRNKVTETFKLHGERSVDGYVVVNHRMGDHAGDVLVQDLVALDRRAAARALELLSGYGSVATVIRWWGGAPDLFTEVLPERRHPIAVTDYWMLRLCDVERALSMRGYPAPLDLALDLDVADDCVPENAGRYVLRVRDGRATVTRGGSGALSIDVRALAALYTGFHDARTLVDLGEASGNESTLAVADAVFAGRAPAMGDFF